MTTSSEPIKISVIIPIYNTAPYLRKCLDSVCGQTYKNLEIICINDSSPDNAAEILDEYAQKDPRIIAIHQENKGIAGARNSGLDVATGDYVIGVDSDDYLAPDLYENVVASMQGTRPDIACFETTLVDMDGNEMPLQNYYELRWYGNFKTHDRLITGTNVCIWNKLFKRELIEQYHLRFSEGIVFEDNAWCWMIGAISKTMSFYPVKGYYYVQRPGSFMHDARKKISLNHLTRPRLFDFICRFFEKHGLIEKKKDLLCSILSELYDTSLKNLLPEDKKEFKDRFKELLSSAPWAPKLGSGFPIDEIKNPLLRHNPFRRRKVNKTRYQFFWIPVLTIRNRKQYRCWQLFGITIYKKPLPQPEKADPEDL